MEYQEDQIDVYIMLQIAGWTAAVLMQGGRVLSFNEKRRHTNYRDPKDRYLSIAEEEFFVVAVRRLLRWLGEAKKRRFAEALSLTEISKLLINNHRCA